MKPEAFALCILLVCGCAWAQSGQFEADKALIDAEARRLPEVKEAAERAGFSFDPSHFQRHIQNQLNAAPLYESAYRALTSSATNLPENLFPSRASLKASEVLVVRKYLQRQVKGISLIHAAAQRAQCVLGFNYTSGDEGMFFPELAKLKFEAKILCVDAQVRAHEGDFRGMGRDYADIGRMVGHLAQGRLIIFDLVACAMGAIAARSAQISTTEAHASPAALAEIRAAFVSFPGDIDLGQTIPTETLLRDETFDSMTRGDLKLSGQAVWSDNFDRFVDKPDAKGLEQAREFDHMSISSTLNAFRARQIEAAIEQTSLLRNPNLSFEKRSEGLKDVGRIWDSGDITYFFLRTASNDESAAYAALTRYHALLNVVVAGTLILQSRNRSGVLPSGAPLDPFTGKPLIFKKTKKGFIVYSVGPNLKDDGGVPHPKADDIPFAYPSVYRS